MVDRELVRGCCESLWRGLGVPVRNQGGFSVVETGIQSAYFNGVVKGSASAYGAKDIARYFRDKSLPCSFWVEAEDEPDELRGMGLQCLGDFPVMMIDRDGYRQSDTELVTEVLETGELFGGWGAVQAEGFGYSDLACDQLVSLCKKSPGDHVVGIHNGMCVSAGSVVVHGDVGYLAMVATLQAQRREGYATAVTCALLDVAWHKGIARCALISSPEAVSMYRGIGFRECGLFHIYT